MDQSAQLTPSQKLWLLVLASFAMLAILAAGIGTGIWMIVNDKEVTDALWVMSLPFVGIILLLAVGSGIYSVVIRGGEQVTDALRLRIVGLLGMALFIGLVGVLLIAAVSDRDVPGALLTLVSTIAGGLIGVLVPSAVPVLFPGGSPTPVVAVVNPDTGPSAGGTPVTITGTGLDGATAVEFGGKPATNVTAKSATEVTATSPAHTPGAVDVIVITPKGTSAANPNARFTYT